MWERGGLNDLTKDDHYTKLVANLIRKPEGNASPPKPMIAIKDSGIKFADLHSLVDL